MTTTMATKGQVVLPKAIRDQLGLSPGDDFEVWVDDCAEIVLRRIRKKPNAGLSKLLRHAPGPLEIPERDRGIAIAPDFS